MKSQTVKTLFYFYKINLADFLLLKHHINRLSMLFRQELRLTQTFNTDFTSNTSVS